MKQQNYSQKVTSLLQNHFMSTTGKTVTLKYLHNNVIATRNVPKFRNNFRELVEEMTSIKGEL